MLVYKVSECLHSYLPPPPRLLIAIRQKQLVMCWGKWGIITLLEEKPQEIKEGRNHILVFCSKWYSVAHLLCL